MVRFAGLATKEYNHEQQLPPGRRTSLPRDERRKATRRIRQQRRRRPALDHETAVHDDARVEATHVPQAMADGQHRRVQPEEHVVHVAIGDLVHI